MHQTLAEVLTVQQVDPDHRPSPTGPPFTGHFKIICDTPRGLQPWQPAADPVVAQGKANADTEAKAKAGPVPKSELNLEVGRNIYEANAKGAKLNKSEGKTNGDGPATNGVSGTPSDELTKAPIAKVNCQTCSADCTRIYYHNNFVDSASNTKKSTDICPSCFVDGRFPGNQLATNYQRMENPTYSTTLDRDAPWTDSELLRLLEGLERFDDDWNEIADHVGTRTREECVLQFLQLDIEDKYLESENSLAAPVGVSMLGSQGGQLPFSQADNPVMSVVAFLASLADPASAAAAAGKSAEELRQHLRGKLESSGALDEQSNGKGKGKEKEGDSMEVDIQQETTTTTTTTTTTKTTALANIPLATIGARADGLASHEEREMTRIVSAAVNITLQKMELKMKFFNEMEAILQEERRELERGRQQLFLDRLAFKKRVRSVQDELKAAALAGGEQGVRMAQDVVMDGERLNLQATAVGGNVQPLSSGGQIKSYEA